MMTTRPSQSGFTLIEVLISTFVFSLIVVAITSVMVQVLANQQRAFAAQSLQENGLFILEAMSREIRVSSIQNQDSSNCSLGSLTMVHPVNGTVTYVLQNGTLRRTVNGITGDLSSSTIQFSRLNFCVLGSGATDRQPTRVTIIAAIQNKGGKNTETFNIQTTITSRDVLSEF